MYFCRLIPQLLTEDFSSFYNTWWSIFPAIMWQWHYWAQQFESECATARQKKSEEAIPPRTIQRMHKKEGDKWLKMHWHSLKNNALNKRTLSTSGKRGTAQRLAEWKMDNDCERFWQSLLHTWNVNVSVQRKVNFKTISL